MGNDVKRSAQGFLNTLGKRAWDIFAAKKAQQDAMKQYEDKHKQARIDLLKWTMQNGTPDQVREATKALAEEEPALAGVLGAKPKEVTPEQYDQILFDKMVGSAQKMPADVANKFLMRGLGMDQDKKINPTDQALINLRNAQAKYYSERDRGGKGKESETMSKADEALWEEMKTYLGLLKSGRMLKDSEKRRLDELQQHFGVEQSSGPDVQRKNEITSHAMNPEFGLDLTSFGVGPPKKEPPINEINNFVNQQIQRGNEAGLSKAEVAKTIDNQLRNKFGIGLKEFNELRKNANR
jgi:hypothetical protein